MGPTGAKGNRGPRVSSLNKIYLLFLLSMMFFLLRAKKVHPAYQDPAETLENP